MNDNTPPQPSDIPRTRLALYLALLAQPDAKNRLPLNLYAEAEHHVLEHALLQLRAATVSGLMADLRQERRNARPELDSLMSRLMPPRSTS
jgi:hypothetical protein